MSGFEIAGIVLGGFPILYEAAKSARSRYRDLKWWWRFETEFEDFISTIDREFISFSQNQEILLSPLDIPSWENDILQNDPNTLLWHDPRIQAQLRKRLSSRYYTWYMEQLHNINKAIVKLLAMLPTGKAYLLGSTSLEAELFRIKWSFGHKKDDLLFIIKHRNESMYAFLDRAAHVSKSFESTRAGSSVWPYLSAQRQATSIYECLQSQWRCHCLSDHACGIRTSKVVQGPGETEPKFLTLLFDEGTRLIELRIEVEEQKPLSITTQSSTGSISQLKQDVSVKSRFKHARQKSSSLVALAASSLSIVGNPSSSGEGQSRLKRLEGKLKKRVRIKDINDDPNEEQLIAPDPPRVRFASDPGPVSFADADEIGSICSVARGEVERPFLGFLSAGHETRLLFRLGPSQVSGPDNLKVESLEAYLDATPRRSQRLQVGLQLIQTVLTLGDSPWVPEKWSKMELLLVRDKDSAEPTPYISHESARSMLKGKQQLVQRSAQARASLFTIGVLLLELLFRKTLESLPLRNEYLGRSGRADYTADLCTAIQWQKQVEEEFGDRIADAIRRCVLCAFEPQPDLSDSAFIRAVCINVVEPLEEFLSAWNTRRSSNA